jgi:hypothetical protein
MRIAWWRMRCGIILRYPRRRGALSSSAPDRVSSSRCIWGSPARSPSCVPRRSPAGRVFVESFSYQLGLRRSAGIWPARSGDQWLRWPILSDRWKGGKIVEPRKKFRFFQATLRDDIFDIHRIEYVASCNFHGSSPIRCAVFLSRSLRSRVCRQQRYDAAAPDARPPFPVLVRREPSSFPAGHAGIVRWPYASQWETSILDSRLPDGSTSCPVCTENLIRVDAVMESRKLAE